MLLRSSRRYGRARLGALLVICCFFRPSAPAADTNIALVDAFVRKGLVTEKEAKRGKMRTDVAPPVAAINTMSTIKHEHPLLTGLTGQSPDRLGKDGSNRK